MKLIIWWMSLMVILPLAYLFWWKKRWRLLLGVIIIAVLAIGYWAPGEIVYSILNTETDREQPLQKLKKTLKSISNAGDEPNPSSPEKFKAEKLIIELGKEVKKGLRRMEEGEKLSEEEISKLRHKNKILQEAQALWINKWGKKEDARTLLFCGEEFNEQLMREKKSVNDSRKVVANYNIIDFGKAENNKLDAFKNKIQEIYQREENRFERFFDRRLPIIWLKNIDKIKNSKLKEELLKVVDPSQNTNLGKCEVEERYLGKMEKVIDLSQFILVATTSTASPKLSNELRTKLKVIEPFLEKHQWVFFFSSLGVEMVVFALLIRSRKKSKNKSLKHLED